MKRKKHTVTVDFGSAPAGSKFDRRQERVRYLWMMLDQIQYPLRELLSATKPSRQRKWLREAKKRYRRFGRTLKNFKVGD